MMKVLPALILCLAPIDAVLAQTSQTASTPPRPWYERLTFGGDFRSRYEGFYREDETTRNRVRMRLRLRLAAAVNEDVRLNVQVASGDPGTPVSTNQTFTGFFQPKPFNLDRAFIQYDPEAAPALTLGLGKFAAPQTTTQMTFDEDLNYEGGWQQVSWSPREGLAITLVGLQAAVNERSAAPDAFMLGGYGEVSVELGPHRLQLSAANYGWGRADQIAGASADGSLDSILTNAVLVDAAGNVVFASRFNVVDVIAEAILQTGRPGFPLRILGEVAQNTRAASDRDRGVWMEAEYGEPRETGSWGAGYTYGWVEQDVTPSAFVFSDMPGTNVRLHLLEASYILKTGLSLDATLHLTRRLVLEVPSEPDAWLSRLHLAAVVRF